MNTERANVQCVRVRVRVCVCLQHKAMLLNRRERKEYKRLELPLLSLNTLRHLHSVLCARGPQLLINLDCVWPAMSMA